MKRLLLLATFLATAAPVQAADFCVGLAPGLCTGIEKPSIAVAVTDAAKGATAPVTTMPTARKAAVLVRLMSRSATTAGRVSVQVTCSGASCSSALLLKRRVGKKLVKAGGATYVLQPGARKTFSVRLSKTTLRALRSRGSLGLTAAAGGTATKLSLKRAKS